MSRAHPRGSPDPCGSEGSEAADSALAAYSRGDGSTSSQPSLYWGTPARWPSTSPASFTEAPGSSAFNPSPTWPRATGSGKKAAPPVNKSPPSSRQPPPSHHASPGTPPRTDELGKRISQSQSLTRHPPVHARHPGSHRDGNPVTGVSARTATSWSDRRPRNNRRSPDRCGAERVAHVRIVRMEVATRVPPVGPMFAARLNRTVVCHDDQRIRPEHRTSALRRPAQATWLALAIAGAGGAVGALRRSASRSQRWQ
jgi:hypothetical protein